MVGAREREALSERSGSGQPREEGAGEVKLAARLMYASLTGALALPLPIGQPACHREKDSHR